MLKITLSVFLVGITSFLTCGSLSADNQTENKFDVKKNYIENKYYISATQGMLEAFIGKQVLDLEVHPMLLQKLNINPASLSEEEFKKLFNALSWCSGNRLIELNEAMIGAGILKSDTSESLYAEALLGMLNAGTGKQDPLSDVEHAKLIKKKDVNPGSISKEEWKLFFQSTGYKNGKNFIELIDSIEKAGL